MVLGEAIQRLFDYRQYYEDIKKDFNQLKEYYPFSKICIIPTVKPSPVEIEIVAASRELVKEMEAKETDFTGEYSRRLKVVVPFDYKKRGCNVYGGAWLDAKRIKESDQHFYTTEKKNGMPLLCVGVPSSFAEMKNVLLENVRTADEMLNAYELLLCGKTQRLILKAYAHGYDGERQYETDRKKYRPD